MGARSLPKAIIGISLLAIAIGVVTTSAAIGATDSLRADVRAPGGADVGVIRFNNDDGKVLVKARMWGLAPGFHGFHVHTAGICDPAATDGAGAPSAFFTAGGHYNPTSAIHGAHAGDMPPLLVAADGTATLRFTTDRFTFGQLMDANGSAVIVHAGPDNLAHIPGTTATGGERYHSHVDMVLGADTASKATGDAGARAGCGVVRLDG